MQTRNGTLPLPLPVVSSTAHQISLLGYLPHQQQQQQQQQQVAAEQQQHQAGLLLLLLPLMFAAAAAVVWQQQWLAALLAAHPLRNRLLRVKLKFRGKKKDG